ncbi:hypothetical protein DPMN_152066 [Dreissena polymorpha]|uniref:Uncharacterized protein n=2 Tax=Dreissena polymorpha TaxID=45954 RepID=A0A9D4FMC8_DREPO|nr:hypothetical protein DPMN_152066 [Dreissena polymorpha]
MNIPSVVNMNDVTYIVRSSSMATKKQAVKARVKSKLRRLRSKLFLGDKNKLQSTLSENLNFDKPVNKCYNKDIPFNCASRVACKTNRIILPVRVRGDGADYVTSTESPLRTRGDGADDPTIWTFPARTPGDGNDGDATGTRSFCDLDAGFLSEEETCGVCDLDICIIDDVSVTSYQDSAFIEEYGSDSVCELEKNVFDDSDISMTTLTRLRSVFSEGGNIDAIVSDSALESFMRD